tara:strand:+ start:2127 stop:2417 length:291 start_codon:yes stop_codon:yes gene_type:complete
MAKKGVRLIDVKLIPPDGEEKIVKVDIDHQLEELQALVKGYIELVPCTETGKLMIINEEGKLLNLPLNIMATKLMEYKGCDFICGNALLIDAVDFN